MDKKLKGGEKATTVKRNTRKHDAQGETTGHPLKWSSLGECLNPVSVGKSSVVFVTQVFQKITWINQMRPPWASRNPSLNLHDPLVFYCFGKTQVISHIEATLEGISYF